MRELMQALGDTTRHRSEVGRQEHDVFKITHVLQTSVASLLLVLD
jgi:helix-turn-helix protein